MKIYLLTHEREVHKKTNTGQVVKNCLGDMVELIIWQRTAPDEQLLKLIASGKAAMLFPLHSSTRSQISEPLSDGDTQQDMFKGYDSFIIIDATWQQAEQIYKRSAYLHTVDKISLNADTKSNYRLRRNQIEHGLSTAECVIELLKYHNKIQSAERLQAKFNSFNTIPGHKI